MRDLLAILGVLLITIGVLLLLADQLFASFVFFVLALTDLIIRNNLEDS